MASKTYTQYEKLWLATIPVIGSIIVAIIVNGRCQPPKPDHTNLKNKAGKVNEIAVYGNYNDLLPLLATGTRPFLTREMLQGGYDSIKKHLGNYIKPIDTTTNLINGTTYYYVKNQYENGQNLMIISFDNDNNVAGLNYKELSK